MKPIATSCLVIAGLLLFGSTSLAGNNASGTAYLSWDRADTVSTIQIPETDPFPLYLRIGGAPDIRSLAVTLSWMPYETPNLCYYRPVSSTQTDDCGAATDAPPGGSFDGDTGYTWSIGFSILDSAKDCVTYSFSKAPCDTAPPGKFVIKSILALDSNGAVDSLEAVGAAKVMGESGVGPPDFSRQEERRGARSSQLAVTLRPNPTQASITFDLTVPVSGDVRIGIYDLAGRLLKDFVREEVRAGKRSYTWNLATDRGTRVRSGVYFARITAPGAIRLIRLVVVE